MLQTNGIYYSETPQPGWMAFVYSWRHQSGATGERTVYVRSVMDAYRLLNAWNIMGNELWVYYHS